MADGRYDRLWERLLEFLEEWSTTRVVGPGRLEVTVNRPETPVRTVEVLLTEDQWGEMVGVAWGGFGPELRQHVRDTVLRVRPPDRFLVYEDYDLVPSATPDLPPDPEEERMAQLLREHPEGFGRWVALDRDGNVVDELRRLGD
jgi:hypothetical protein